MQLSELQCEWDFMQEPESSLYGRYVNSEVQLFKYHHCHCHFCHRHYHHHHQHQHKYRCALAVAGSPLCLTFTFHWTRQLFYYQKYVNHRTLRSFGVGGPSKARNGRAAENQSHPYNWNIPLFLCVLLMALLLIFKSPVPLFLCLLATSLPPLHLTTLNIVVIHRSKKLVSFS